MGTSGGSAEDPNANRHADSKDGAHEVSEGNKETFEIELEAIHVTFWQKRLLCICLHPETFCEIKFKSDGVTNLAEKIPRQHSIRWWHGYFLLLLASYSMRTGIRKESFEKPAVWP